MAMVMGTPVNRCDDSDSGGRGRPAQKGCVDCNEVSSDSELARIRPELIQLRAQGALLLGDHLGTIQPTLSPGSRRPADPPGVVLDHGEATGPPLHRLSLDRLLLQPF